MAHFTLRLPDALAARFDGHAAPRGGRSRLLRQLIEDVVGGSAVGEAGLEAPRRGASEKVTLRLKPEELAALDAESAAAGLRRTEWAAACLRGRLIRRPTFTTGETRDLASARGELARISTNLRETVRMLREADAPAEVLDAAMARMEGFRAEVRDELDRLRTAIDDRARYWETDG